MKALAPLTLDLQPRPVHRSVPVMHANGSGGVAQTVTPRFVFLLWGLETNYGILHVHLNVNYTEMKRVVLSQSNRQQPRAEDSSFSQYWKEQPKSQHQRTKTYNEGREAMSRECPRHQLLIVFHQVSVSPSSHQRVKTKHRDRSDLSVNIRQEIRAPAPPDREPESILYFLQACTIKN